MEYITIFETFERSQAHILSNIFENNQVEHRLLDERTNDVIPMGIRVQVLEEQKERALVLLRENGFLGERLATTDEPPSGKFWIYLFFALIIVIIIAVVIAFFLE